MCSEVPNMLIYWKFSLPLLEWFLKSSTGGVWNSNRVAQFQDYVLQFKETCIFCICIQDEFGILGSGILSTFSLLPQNKTKKKTVTKAIKVILTKSFAIILMKMKLGIPP